ncbi:tetratricopeptide repeat protein [Propionivibrio sp.]|uniref:tetratricopeptide repeat protein n=1 Tax=Propionivibrio sp. TaxID=2212460 RepID=UPI0025EB9A2A|nr:tetratricopeptide repeat protein [Propionivibrio sp.]MBK8744893.1 tetratricopeptide repeat protein [Propionivibrio sp.]
MTTAIIASLEKLLGGPRDGALLRYSLGNEWLKAGHPDQAADCFREAVKRDEKYSAAWKLLGKALADSGQTAEALAAYAQGIQIANEKGDIQVAKEMAVFARRLNKQADDGGLQFPSA